MNAIVSMKILPPTIQSVGPPPEKHAMRIVSEMIEYLHDRQRDLWARAAGSINTKQMGSVVGQERAIARFQKQNEGLILKTWFTPGSRGRYKLRAVMWMIWNPAGDGGHGDMAGPNNPLPDNAQLAVGIAVRTGRDTEFKTYVPLVITRHAMVRLAERAGVRTVDDLLLVMKLLWNAAMALAEETRTETPPAAGWRKTIDDKPGSPIAVITRDDKGRYFVLTIIPADLADLPIE
jgi:hypothetical protein